MASADGKGNGSGKLVAITTTSFGTDDRTPIRMIEESGYRIVFNDKGRKLEGDEVVTLLGGAIGVIAGTEKITRPLLERLSNLKVISRCGTGMDNVDVKAAKDLGIKVFNTPDAPTAAVAELTLGLILSLLRKVHAMAPAVKAGTWKKQMGNLLCGKNVGVIGLGRIGSKVAELLSAFGAQLSYCDPVSKSCSPQWARMDLDQVLGWADIITLNLSPAPGSMPLIGREQIRKMKKGTWLVNVSRGDVVDEQALYEALKEGHLAGAALDVFQAEPYKGPLLTLENVILTPHIGSYAKESRIAMEIQSVENLLAGLAGC